MNLLIRLKLIYALCCIAFIFQFSVNAQSPQLVYSTLIGGTGWDYGHAIAVDEEGYAYIAGQANSSNYPTTLGAYDRTANGGSDILVSKLNKDGSALVYSTYIGSSDRDDTRKVFVDNSGCVYLTGATQSTYFPVTSNALEGNSQGYFLKLDSTGSNLDYSSRWAGGSKLLIDSEGYIVIVGGTNSENFPTTENAYSRTLAGDNDIFVAKIDIANNNILFSTLLGGNASDRAFSFTLDGQNNIVVTGLTSSSNFPVTGNSFVDFTDGKSNVFVTKLKSDGTELIYSTLIGGSDDEWSFDVVCDNEDNTYITGVTKSEDFCVTSSAFDISYNGDEDIFLTKLSSDGSELLYSTYIGGTSKDGGRGVVVDESGKAYLTGCTKSTDFPLSDNAYDNSFNGAGTDSWAWGDPFLLVMNTEGSQVEYSTYLGGSVDEEAYGIAIDNQGDVYLCGVTGSSDFPTTEGAYDRSLSGSCNIYAIKFSFSSIDYFGQTPPGDTAEIFAPGIISLTDRNEIQITFSPDGKEVYLVASGGNYYTKYENNAWTPQVNPPFAGELPFYSLDGNKIYFTIYNWNSTHTEVTSSNIYAVNRSTDGWSQPLLLPSPINSSSYDGSYTETADSVIYFHSNRSGSYGIWYIDPVSGEAKNLGSVVNSGGASAPCIAPDGSYIVFESSRPGGYGDSDLYVTFNKGNNEWTAPVNLGINGSGINIATYMQIYPSLSPDGKYLFFNRHRFPDSMPDIYWVSTNIIEQIKDNTIGRIDYFGQTPPDDTPERFASGIITGFKHSPIAISPQGDKIFWVETETISAQDARERIKFTRYENGTWTTTTYADFVRDYLSYHHSGTVFSPDGNRLYFISNRPGGLGDFDLWYVEKNETGWGSAVNAGEPYNTTGHEISPIFTSADKAYRLGYTNNSASFTYSNGIFSNPVSIDNQPVTDWYSSVYISPEEDYVIFAGDETPNLYIRFKNNENEWGDPISMGDKINTTQPERFPVVSPDGKYLFFLRGEPTGLNNYFWVSIEIIDSIKLSLTDLDEERTELNNEFRLNQNYPNPFNPTTVVKYQLSNSSNVKLKIYDTLGQEIKTLVDSFQNAGEHSVVWNGKDDSNNPVSSGMYFYSLSTDRKNIQKKMVLLR